MWRLFKSKLDLTIIVNPFYIYPISFLTAIIFYMWGWSSIFPKLKAGIVVFFLFSFLIFLFVGHYFDKKKFLSFSFISFNLLFNDIIFWVIILLGFINVLYNGYLPVLDRTHDYRDFGMHIVDPVFNTMCIFFAVVFLQTYLDHKIRKYLLYTLIIFIIQILLFRRATLVWIFVSSIFLILIYYRKVYLPIVIAIILLVPLLSYAFGLFGTIRSSMNRSTILSDLGASLAFKESGISQNHYMTYLYISSPLANLQVNIEKGKGFLNNKELKAFFFYCIVPESVTKRLEKRLNLTKPECTLINKNLIVGSVFMVSFFTLGWLGMLAMLFFLFAFIIVCLLIIRKWDSFNLITYTLLITTVSLSIFSNFLNRLDVILMLFVYPIVFHYAIKLFGDKLVSKHDNL